MSEILARGGVMMWPLLLLSVLGLALVAQNACLLSSMKKRLRREAGHDGEEGQDAEAPLLPLLAGMDRLNRGIEHLFLIASIAPVCGLLGTVLGIIKSFTALSLSRPDSQILSLGLSEALLTTAAGLVIALPCQVAGHFLQQGLDRLLLRLNRGKGDPAPCASARPTE